MVEPSPLPSKLYGPYSQADWYVMQRLSASLRYEKLRSNSPGKEATISKETKLFNLFKDKKVA